MKLDKQIITFPEVHCKDIFTFYSFSIIESAVHVYSPDCLKKYPQYIFSLMCVKYLCESKIDIPQYLMEWYTLDLCICSM